MKKIFVLFCLSILTVISCKKENNQNINQKYHEELKQSGLAKDSLEKMDIILEKLNQKNTPFLDYYVTYYYKLDKETQDEIKKTKGEHYLEENPEGYFELFTKIISKKGNEYLNSFGISEEEEMLAREVYIFYLKKNYGSTVDAQLENLNK
ncbi:hypothetical protein [Chryseobacterium sp.]|uniref:hypothetical protein n=1 Tax=Chryseobacterium sp. TaxID=1871047 RepID=UPI0025B9F208|nr:hypothetical protein [Chryseobacterium sp.]